MINVHVEGAAEVANGIQAGALGVPSELRSAMTAGLVILEAEARRELTPGHGRDTGRLQGSITHRITGSGATLVGEVGPSVQYGLFVHEGRRPGKMPPVAAIAGWARRHGLEPFLVARAIGRRGIPPNPFLERAFGRSQARITEIFNAVGARVVGRVSR